MKTPAMNLALKMAIHESRKTQKRIAAITRMGEPRLSLIVRGRAEPTAQERERLAKALAKSVVEIFGEAVA